MLVISDLIWDGWNREHLTRHHISPEEVEEVCHSQHKVVESYRKRLVIKGKTKANRSLYIVLSPEDENLKPYGEGTYYPITAFEEKSDHEKTK